MILSKKDYYYYLELDAIANNYKKNLKNSIKNLLSPNLIWNFIKLLRKVEYFSNCKNSLWGKILCNIYKLKLRKIQLRLGFSIPINVFGPGLSLPHYGTIIVNGNAKVGAFCRLHACVNIGASAGDSSAPYIGDNCYIGPSVVIFGNIKIADNVTIGANATVNHTVDQPNVVLAGSPAKIVKENYPTWVTFNKLKIGNNM